jgi:uncharacterized protein (TIGR02147 family)
VKAKRTSAVSCSTTPGTFRLHLQTELGRRCAGNPQYSLRAFAKYLVIDHATLSQLLRCKRRFTQATIEKLGKRLRLDDSLIAGYVAWEQQASQLAESAATLHEVQQLARDTANLISDWYHFAILELIHLPQFKPDTRWIARVLEITPDECNVALTRLMRLRLLEMKATDCWIDRSGSAAASMNEFAQATIAKLQEQVGRLLAVATRVNGSRFLQIPKRKRKKEGSHGATGHAMADHRQGSR